MKHPFFAAAGMAALVAAGAANSATAAATAVGAPAAIPIEAFFDNPALWAPELSPSGDALAVQMRVDGHRVLAVVDAATLKKITVVARFDTTDVGHARWVNDRRLVFDQQFEGERGSNDAWHGLWAVDRDGSRLRMLIRPDVYANAETGSNIKDRTLTADHYLRATVRDGSSDVIVERQVFGTMSGNSNRYYAERRLTVPMRLDTTNGLARDVVEGHVPDHAASWLFDDQGNVRAVFISHAGEDTLLAPKDGGWTALARFPSYGPGTDSLSAAMPGADGELYVVTNADAPGRPRALYRFDAAHAKAHREPLVLVKGFDFDGELAEDRCHHKVLGAHYASDALGTAWFDPAMAALQGRVDGLLPGRVNRLDVADCPGTAPVLVTSMSDHSPAQYYLYGPGDSGLRSIAVSRPAIDPRQMADTDFFRFKARDGREIPVYVTKPRGKGPWPAVVLVHGGPNLRGWSWEWDAESQFLASRGYVVVKPEFRGSDGYGADLMEAGFRQWGLAMQDDVADATRWAAAQGLADPKRTCIAGASYGGYAALMGLARYPELYRCGIAASAVADIDMMYATWWSDGDDDWRNFGMPMTVGDRQKDAAQFKATSPLMLAAHITKPLLLEHGGRDRRVPLEQASAMRDALQAGHAPVTWLYYPEEGHGFDLSSDRIDYYRHVEAFLAENIGAP